MKILTDKTFLKRGFEVTASKLAPHERAALANVYVIDISAEEEIPLIPAALDYIHQFAFTARADTSRPIVVVLATDVPMLIEQEEIHDYVINLHSDPETIFKKIIALAGRQRDIFDLKRILHLMDASWMLTLREAQMVNFLQLDFSVEQMANSLRLSEKTVYSHLNSLKNRLNKKSLSQAAAWLKSWYWTLDRSMHEYNGQPAIRKESVFSESEHVYEALLKWQNSVTAQQISMGRKTDNRVA